MLIVQCLLFILFINLLNMKNSIDLTQKQVEFPQNTANEGVNANSCVQNNIKGQLVKVLSKITSCDDGNTSIKGRYIYATDTPNDSKIKSPPWNGAECTDTPELIDGVSGVVNENEKPQRLPNITQDSSGIFYSQLDYGCIYNSTDCSNGDDEGSAGEDGEGGIGGTAGVGGSAGEGGTGDDEGSAGEDGEGGIGGSAGVGGSADEGGTGGIGGSLG